MLKSSHGFAPIVLILIVVALALAGGGYFLFNKSGTSIPGLPSTNLNSNCKFNDPDLCKFLNNWQAASQQYSIKTINTSKNSANTETLFELSGTDKFHMLTSEAGKEVYNLISIGDTTYTKDLTDGKWWKQKTQKTAEDLKAQNEFKAPEATNSQEVDKTTYQALGKEACETMQCFKYQVLNPDNGDSTEYIWFDDKNYLIRKNVVESKDLGTSESTFNYNNINISTPSPTKDAPEGKVIMPSGAAITPIGQDEFNKLQESSKNLIQERVPIIQDQQDNTNPDESTNP
jgi:hypothetical protein